MPYLPLKASAPGSLMLMGEHAVLQGYPAMACAINRFITVKLKPRRDQQIIIQSALGEYQADRLMLNPSPPFQFVLSVLKRYQRLLPSGCELEITSQFSDKVGLGSSAAVTVATLAVLHQWLEQDIDLYVLWQQAHELIQGVQGLGSGADIAASCFGGTISLNPQHQHIEPLERCPPLHAVYSGAKTPTVTVVQQVNQMQRQEPERFATLFQQIGGCVHKGYQALLQENWSELGRLLNFHQLLQEQLGVSTPLLNELIAGLMAQPGIYGAKISGSGLGDCVIGLGKLRPNTFPRSLSQQQAGVQQLNIQVSRQGLFLNDSP